MFDPIVLASSTATWVINKLLDSLTKAAIKALLKKEDLDQEVEKLKNALQRTNLVLGAVPVGVAAGVKIENTNLEEPIQEVQQLATELTKYLDELEYYDIKDKVKQNIPKKSWMKTITHAVGHSNPKNDKVYIARIRAIVEKLHNICGNVYEALYADKLAAVIQAIKITSTDMRENAQYSTQTKVFSRDNVKNKILEVISTRASSDQVSVIPIVGDGGVGKTTLAQLVYNDPEVQAKFDIMIWIYVSANFDEVKLTQKILEQIPECGHKNTKSLAGLQHDMNKFLSKRFLLVLDDMWEESEGRWDKLLAPIRATQVKGNVILVTTRSLSVARITTRTEADHINLDGLDEQDFFPFFKRCIFGDENFQGQRKLLKIAEDIASKLNRNPLAAKSVGSLLRRNVNVEDWIRIRDSDEWRFNERKDAIIPALKLSYNHLPYHLQLLFSYCAIFPKGYKFDKEELIRTWIALGFVVHERKKLEDQGSDCFDDLVDWSFFHKHEQYFVVHDLMHDVAQEVMVKKCLIIDCLDLRKVFPSTCHLGIWTELAYNEQSIERNEDFEEKLDSIQDKDILKRLESLILVGLYDENFSAKLVTIFEQLHYVRVLRLQFNDVMLLSSIKKFIHLRYLELRYTSDKHKPLPKHICKLYHLQTLDVRHWNGLDDLPEGMNNLVNLRYLLVPGSGSLHSKISRVGDLEFLQELKEFRVQKKDGFDISQLGNLKEIKGSLSILDLENVTNKEEATRAGIKQKKHLRSLSLSWGSASASPATIQDKVMEGLKPHENLAHLTVVNYAGATPLWLAKNLSLTNLESLHLQDCPAVKILPPFQIMPFLRTLSLVGLSSLNDCQIDFQSCEEEELELNEIQILKCSALTSIRLHSCKALTKLSIKDCGALTKLSITNCGALASLELEGMPSSDQLMINIQGCSQLPSGFISN
ncbi:hypothetical protein PAHAL_8G242700 [Panicum hallii]|uniref:Uncharacterized protein n=1 Tax=Panicum hallii TaxID=206008 RepID=A0A2S3IFF8_9POAL|nr:putative disease resistance protein RGA3 [Panicum hallii]PAN43538.1 hypothetical protein PAHAL_8G242700 [Panicum hallii]